MAPASPRLTYLAAGFGVWAAGFVVLYAATSLGCTLGWEAVPAGPLSLQRAILVALVLATAAAALAVAYRLSRQQAGDGEGPAAFVLSVARMAAVAAVPAVGFTFSGVVGLSAC